VNLCCHFYLQVGSLVDGSDDKADRNSIYKYYDNLSSSEFEDTTSTRTTLVQTIRQLKPGEEILVYYGSEYSFTAMPTTTSQ
jgi:hypothetical protein